MTGSLLLAIAGLALLDSINPATLVTVSLILLLPGRHPVATALAFVLGAYTAVALAGAAVFLAADQAADAVAEGTAWLRRLAFAAVAVALLVSGLRRLRRRHRRAVALPTWFTPWTAAPFGVLVTGADLPNAFPYVIAIERMVTVGVPVPTGLLVIASYGVVYCLPCLVLLAVGVRHGTKVRARLDRIYRRFGSAGPVPRSFPAAAALLAGAAAAAAVASTA